MTRALAALLAAVCLAAGCGSDSPTAEAPDPTVPLVACEPGTIDDVTVTGALGEEPKVELANDVSVDTSTCAVLIEGSGIQAVEGDIIEFTFTFVNGRTGNVYGTSFTEGIHAELPLDDRPVRGLRQALTGAQAGSRVVVAASPEDGYALKGADEANDLKDSDSLVMVVDVLKVTHVLPRAEGTAVAPAEGLPTVRLGEDGSPSIVIPSLPAPTELVVQTLIEGAGAPLEAGQTFHAHYTGVLWGSGQPFDSSWEFRAIEDELVVGGQTPGTGGLVTEGWVQGLVGKTVGSQVLLVIPPSLAYGEAGLPAAGIGPTDTLVYVIDILEAH